MIELMDYFLTLNRYKGKFTPENLVFNANLQEFAHRVSYICELVANDQISPQEALTQVEVWFEALERSQQQLLIGSNPFGRSELDE